MQVGSLVKHKKGGFIGVLIEQSQWRSRWFVVWSDNKWNGWCERSELEVLCK